MMQVSKNGIVAVKDMTLSSLENFGNNCRILKMDRDQAETALQSVFPDPPIPGQNKHRKMLQDFFWDAYYKN